MSICKSIPPFLRRPSLFPSVAKAGYTPYNLLHACQLCVASLHINLSDHLVEPVGVALGGIGQLGLRLLNPKKKGK